jgi:hypothetical protein
VSTVKKSVPGQRISALQVCSCTYNIVLVIFLHLLDVGVDERLQAVSLTADAEFWAASLQGGSRKQDEFRK